MAEFRAWVVIDQEQENPVFPEETDLEPFLKTNYPDDLVDVILLYIDYETTFELFEKTKEVFEKSYVDTQQQIYRIHQWDGRMETFVEL